VKITLVVGSNQVTALAVNDGIVYTGGEFGKVLMWKIDLNGKFTGELIDQQQAHKRRVVSIIFSKDYIFTCSLDQKIKQWTLKTNSIVANFDIDFLPNSIWVHNATLFVGGRSLLASFELTYYDKPSIGSSRTRTEENQTDGKTPIVVEVSSQGFNSNVLLIIAAVGAALLLIVASIFFYNRRKQYSNVRTTTEEMTLSIGTDVTVTFQTLIGTVLNISLPLYKECTATDFRCIEVIGQGGVGTVYVGQALSKNCAMYGQTIVVKKIVGNF
jgi:WD40 repeat protein